MLTSRFLTRRNFPV